MKRPLHLVLPLLGALAPAPFVHAQSAPVNPQTPVGPVTPEQRARFADLTTVTPAVAGPAQVVVSLADAIRQGLVIPAANAIPLPTAVAAASTAVVREGQVARASVLSERQATLTRLRLAQSEADRQRLIENLRLQSGERMDDQREAARLVRDRLRQLRDDATLTRAGTK
ncbi:MAG: hypothetical protein NTV51_15080 [Verrucomicrobia bacterium]|nr:hypothetical protein [Verrucomicrobiota bacterium]